MDEMKFDEFREMVLSQRAYHAIPAGGSHPSKRSLPASEILRLDQEISGKLSKITFLDVKEMPKWTWLLSRTRKSR